MIKALLFDFGGTLDSDGLHWLDRFYQVYEAVASTPQDRARIKEAFYVADRALEQDPEIREMPLRGTIERHVALQMKNLGLQCPDLAERLVTAYVNPMRRALDQSKDALRQIHFRYRTGVVSNFYGNVEKLCEESGLISFLDVVVDSAVAGVAKPDPRIFERALRRLSVMPSEAVMVGDSVQNDILPARQLGMKTIWVRGPIFWPGQTPGMSDWTVGSVREIPDLLKKVLS